MADAIPIDVHRLDNPSQTEAGPWYWLTPKQRTVVSRAIEAGYYSIPMEISTNDLGAEVSITDQAVTERLRRGVRNLLSSTLLLPGKEETGERQSEVIRLHRHRP